MDRTPTSPPPQLATSSSSNSFKVLAALFVLGAVGGGVIGARYIRDFRGVAKDAERIYKQTHPPPKPKSAVVTPATAEMTDTQTAAKLRPQQHEPTVATQAPQWRAQQQPAAKSPAAAAAGAADNHVAKVHPQARPRKAPSADDAPHDSDTPIILPPPPQEQAASSAPLR